jgi:hypothetical protein
MCAPFHPKRIRGQNFPAIQRCYPPKFETMVAAVEAQAFRIMRGAQGVF